MNTNRFQNIVLLLIVGFLGYTAYEKEVNSAAKQASDYIAGLIQPQEKAVTEVELAEPDEELRVKVAVISEKLADNKAAAKRLAALFYNKSLADFSGIQTVGSLREYHRQLNRLLKSNKALVNTDLAEEVDRILMGAVQTKDGWITEADRQRYRKACAAIAWACKEATSETLSIREYREKDDTAALSNFDDLNGFSPNYEPITDSCILEPIEDGELRMMQEPEEFGKGTRGPPRGLIFNQTEHEDFLKRVDRFSDTFLNGTSLPETRLLYRAAYKYDPEAFTAEPQQTGDCVSHAVRWAGDCSRAVEISVGLEPDQWINRGATEPIYGARQTSQQGMTISRAADFINDIGGYPIRKKYCNGKYDFSKYNWRVGDGWGRTGVPQDLAIELQKTKMLKATLCTNPEEVAAAIRSGFGVFFGSDISFSRDRDANGFLRRGRQRWYHSMCFIAVSTAAIVGGEDWKRYGPTPDSPVFGLNNSWGNFFSGPVGKFADFPRSGGWVSYNDAKYIIRQRQTIAIGNYQGIPVLHKTLNPEFANAQWPVVEGVFDAATFGIYEIAMASVRASMPVDITIPEGTSVEEEVLPEPPTPEVKEYRMIDFDDIRKTGKETGLPVVAIIGGDACVYCTKQVATVNKLHDDGNKFISAYIKLEDYRKRYPAGRKVTAIPYLEIYSDITKPAVYGNSGYMDGQELLKKMGVIAK